MPINTLPKADKYGVYTKHTTPQNRLAEYFCDNDTNKMWVYVRANEAITRGAGIASRAVQTITAGLLATDAGLRDLRFGSATDLNALFPRVPNQPQFAEYMRISVQEGGGQIGTVYEHSQRQMSIEWTSEDDFKLRTNLVADADLALTTSWLVVEASTTAAVIGFAQRDIAAGEYFWALVEGLGWGRANAAIAAGAALRIADTEGELDDIAEASATPVDVCAYAEAAAAANGLFSIKAAAPARISIPDFHGGRSEISYDHPAAE